MEFRKEIGDRVPRKKMPHKSHVKAMVKQNSNNIQVQRKGKCSGYLESKKRTKYADAGFISLRSIAI